MNLKLIRTIAQFRDIFVSLFHFLSNNCTIQGHSFLSFIFSQYQKFTWRCVWHRFRANLPSLDFAFLFWLRIFSSHGYTRSDAFSLTVPKHRLWSFAYWLWLFLNLKDSHPPPNLILSVSIIIIVWHTIDRYWKVHGRPTHQSTDPPQVPRLLWQLRRFSTVGRVSSASPYLLFWLYKLVIHLLAYPVSFL